MIRFSTAKPFDTLKIEDNLYHAIGGFNLCTIDSILKNGILSKAEADKKGIKINSNGQGENGIYKISVSTFEVLTIDGYAGSDVSFIVNPKGLTVTTPLSSEVPFHERQIWEKIDIPNIIGIMIPNSWLSSNFLINMKIVKREYFWNKDALKFVLENLDCFFQGRFDVSILGQPEIMTAYQAVLNVNVDSDYITASKNICETIDNLNKTLSLFITSLYKNLFKTQEINITDILNYHSDSIPVYNTQGIKINHCQNSELIEKNLENDITTSRSFKP